MTLPDYYRANAAALRALLRALPEPAQQDVTAAALALDHAAVQAEEFEDEAYQRRMRALIAEAAEECRCEPRPVATRDERVCDLMPTAPVRYGREP